MMGHTGQCRESEGVFDTFLPPKTYFHPSEAAPRHPLVTAMGGTGPGLSVWVEQREQKIYI